MRFSPRTLAQVFSALAVASSATLFLSRPAIAQDAAKTDAAPAKDAAAAPATDATAAGSAEAADPKPLLEKGDAAMKAGDYGAALAAYNDAGRAAQAQLQQGGSADAARAQVAALVGRGRAQIGLREFESAERDFRAVLQDAPD